MEDQKPTVTKKAFNLEEIDAAVNKFLPVCPKHHFYVDFEDLRGDFKERDVMHFLNAKKKGGEYTFNAVLNQANKTLFFLAGMRGSGKTSELAKYAKKLHRPECFFVVTCNIDDGLDLDNVQYMDIVIFQLKQLLEQAAESGIALSADVVGAMEEWLASRIDEINKRIKAEGGVEIELGAPSSAVGVFAKLLGITGLVKMGLSGSVERAQNIRTNLKNNFPDFSRKFNLFIEHTNAQLRKQNKGQEVLFIVDGLEKTMTADTRRKIILEESNRIREIRANTIFTLPIELMKETQRIRNFSEVVNFPFIKIVEKNGTAIEPAVKAFETLVYKRVDERLFENTATVHLAINKSGGLPRQLLRIIERAAQIADEERGIITFADMNKAIEKLGNDMARYVEPEEFAELKRINAEIKKGNPIGFDSEMIQTLLEKELLMEYNDGTDKRVNPLLLQSKLYQHHVL